MTPEQAKQLNLNSGHTMKEADNELEYCTRCCGYEGGLPSHCPGVVMDGPVAEAVYQGRIDFRNGKWCNQPTTHMYPHYANRPLVEYANLKEAMR